MTTDRVASDPAAVATLPTAVRDACAAAERAGLRVRLGSVDEFTLVVLGPTDAGKTALVSALLSDAVGGFVGLAERPGRGTRTPVEYVYGNPPALWLGIGGTGAEPADWVEVPCGTPDLRDVRGLCRVRVQAPARVLRDWNVRIVDCPGLDGPEDLVGPVGDEVRRPGVGVAYVVPRRGITDVDAQALEMLREVPTVLIENRRDAELRCERSTLDELAVSGLNTGLAVPLAVRRLARPGPEREALRRCVALLRTRTGPARWAATVQAAALRSRDALCADFVRRHTLALVARHPDWTGSLHVLADLLSIERDGPELIDLTDRLTEVAGLAEAAEPAASLRERIDLDIRSTVERYNAAAATDSDRPHDDQTEEFPRFAQSYIDIRDELIAVLDGVLADPGLRLTGTDRTALSGTRAGVLSDRLEIAVLGQFSSGKSTLINALLKEQCLPASPRPTTTAVTQLEFAPEASLSVAWLPRVDLRLLSPGAEPHQVRVHVDEIRALGRWLRDRTVLARDCVFHPLFGNRATRDGEAAFWRLWKLLDLAGQPQLYAYLMPSRDKPRLTDLSVPAEVTVRRFAGTPDQWPGERAPRQAFAELADNPALALRVDAVTLGIPHPLLQHVTIVDTPGTDTPAPHHRAVAHRAVRDKRHCAVIYCFDGAKPASREDSANLSFLRDCRIASTDLARFFFVITRRGVAEPDADRVRQAVRETLLAAGTGTPRTYFTEVVTELNDDFRDFAGDLARFVLGSKRVLLRSWAAHASRVIEDLHDRHARCLDGFHADEQGRLARLNALHAEAATLASIQDALVGWLSVEVPQRLPDHTDLAALGSRRAFDRVAADLGADLDRLNEETRRSVEGGCAALVGRLSVELAQRLPGRRINPPALDLAEEFFASAPIDYAIDTLSWRSRWERFKGLFDGGWRGRASDLAANREHLADAWRLSRERGERLIADTLDGYLAGLEDELARLAQGLAAEIATAAMAPSDHDRVIATEGRDHAVTWLARLDALSRTCTGGGEG